MTYVLKGMSKSLKYTWWSLMYQIQIGLEWWGFCKQNAVFNKTVVKLVTWTLKTTLMGKRFTGNCVVIFVLFFETSMPKICNLLKS